MINFSVRNVPIKTFLFRKYFHDNFDLFHITQFEADRRAFIITINSFGTELGKDDRNKLYPKCGKLYPEGLSRLAKADDYEQVRAVADYYSVGSFAIISVFI